MSWHKIWLVVRREYGFNFKRPSFLFTAFGVPLITLGMMFLVIKLAVNQETNLSKFQRIGYVDLAGVISETAPNPDHYQPIVAPQDGSATAEAVAHQQLVDGQLDAYFVIAENYALTGQVDLYARKSIPQALHDQLQSFMRNQIAAKAPSDLGVPIDRLRNPVELVVRDLDTNKELSEAAIIGRILLPFIFVFIYFMATSTTAQFLMSGVVEEKENRLMEILATSLRPSELLWGKMLGLGLLSLTQVVLWAAAGLVIAASSEQAQSFIGGARFQAGDIALVVVLFLINFLLYAAIMMGIGASVTAEAESRQFAGLVTFAAVLPIMLLATFLQNPDGPIPVFLSLFPLTAATGLIMRIGLTAVPNWQVLLSLTVQVASALGVMWLATKAFRLGMLMYGKALTPRELWHALREGRVIMTTAPQAEPAIQKKQRRKRGGLK
jgi:ABC-2 type transport system permease protein